MNFPGDIYHIVLVINIEVQDICDIQHPNMSRLQMGTQI